MPFATAGGVNDSSKEDDGDDDDDDDDDHHGAGAGDGDGDADDDDGCACDDDDRSRADSGFNLAWQQYGGRSTKTKNPTSRREERDQLRIRNPRPETRFAKPFARSPVY